jgi:hypothetical protein
MSESEIEREINQFVDSMAALGITLSEDEIGERRRLLEAKATGDMALAYADDDAVSQVESWEEVGQLPADKVQVVKGFVKLDDKSKLINIPFFIRKLWFTEGEMGQFVVMQIVTKYPIKTDSGETSTVIVTDGSTGICNQLRESVMDTGKTTGIIVRNGLRVSQYTADTDEGPKLAETYYLT